MFSAVIAASTSFAMAAEINKCHSEFVPSERANGDEYKLEYSRAGGCFVTTKKALFFVFLAVCAIVLAVALMYYYGPNKNQNQTKEITPNNLEKLLVKTTPPKTQLTHTISTLHPLHYKLQIHPSLRGTFAGAVEILLHCVNKTDKIILNVEDLRIIEWSVNILEAAKIIHNKSYDRSKQIYTITLKTPLKMNANYTLHVEFLGNISDDFAGIYRTNDNKNRTFIATNLQNNQAKRVFPCLDVPTQRATFEIAIARKTNMVAVSNMPLLKSVPMLNTTGWVWDHFKTTPPLPLHLVAFVVCQCKDSLVDETTVAKIWTNTDDFKLSYAKQNLRKIITFLEDYFNTKFPFAKIDFVVVPNMLEDAVNALGLVFFRPSSIALEDNTLKAQVFGQMASQLAQQWFGDLVSTNAYLSKGFALFVSQLMLDKYHLHGNYLTKTLEPAFDEEEGETDKKAASLLRMLFDVVPKNTFKNALKGFLEKWRYKTALAKDFWDSFTYQFPNNLTVVGFVESWTKKSGYPLIHVYNKNDTFEVAQTNLNNQTTKWPIPLSYTVSSNVNVSNFMWLATEKTQIKLNDSKNNKTWVLFNSNETGFYRVNYDKHNLLLLQKNFDAIATKNRAQILNDALELAALDFLDYNTALNLTKNLVNEKDYSPWAAVFESFSEISLVIANTHHQEIFKKYIVKLTESVYKNLGTTQRNNETITQTYLRNLILKHRCDVQEEACVNWSKRLYANWMNSSETIPHAVRKIAQCTAISAGNQKEWEFLLQDATESDAYLSLGCARQSWIIEKYLEMSLQGKIHIQYVAIVWKSLTHPVAINSGFKFLRSNWERIKRVYGDNKRVLKAIFLDFLSRLSTMVDLEDLTTFYKKEEESLKEVAPMLLKAVEKIKFRIQWSSKHLVEVVGWMKNNTILISQ